MKPQQKQLRRFRRGRINPRQELRRQSRIRNNLEKSFYKRLTSLLFKFINTKAFLYREYGQYEVEVASRDLQEELTPTITQHYRRVFRTIVNSNNDVNRLDKKEDEVFVFDRNVDIEAWIEEYYKSRELVLSGISANMARRVEKIIRQGREEGLTLREIAANISTKLRPISRARAATIARTETHNAAGFAHHKYYKQVATDYGSKMLKRWGATNDLRTRSAHSIANGQIREIDEDFDVDGLPMAHTGDPRGGARNNINCRCVIIYVDEQDVVLD